MQKHYYIYFLTNKLHTVLYTGVTNNLERRLFEHRNGETYGFSKQYNLVKLVYYELYKNSADAIAREKQIKRWSRAKKDYLVNQLNSQWKDLSEDWFKGDPSTSLRSGRDDSITLDVIPSKVEGSPLKKENHD